MLRKTMLAMMAIGCSAQMALIDRLYKGDAAVSDGPMWPDTFSVQGSEILTGINGSKTPWDYSCQAAWYYDFPNKRARFDHLEGQIDAFCLNQNLSNSDPKAPCHLIFAPNRAMYVHYPTQKTCCSLCLDIPGIDCTVLKPDWIADGHKIGTETIDGAECAMYEKQGSVAHDYWASTADNVPCRYHENLQHPKNVLHNITFDRSTYSTAAINDSIFDVPSYCHKLCPKPFPV